jgi:hypothetical protein
MTRGPDEWIKTLTPAQRKRLSQYECAWCNERLHTARCGAIYECCFPYNREAKAARCLDEATAPQLRCHELKGSLS